MADHDELVGEMLTLDQMGTQERQKLAKKRRLQQLKKWSQREKEWIAKEKQLNKRLASTINEENNGLNLKQYTSYGSNKRAANKRRPLVEARQEFPQQHHQQPSTNATKSHTKNTSNTNNNNINNNNNIDNKLISAGKVHFDVGVMLLEAAARNDFDEVKRLLALGVSPDSINHDGLTALHQCCIDASEPMMNLLLEYGANVDARDTEQWTPLHAACTCGHLNLVKILVKYQADLLAVNGDGNMPFDICEDEETLNFIESEMVKKGITQEMIDLTRASAEMQMLEELERRLTYGEELNKPDASNGVTYLHVAAANNYISVVKFMLKHNVNVNVCDNDLWTPLHGAACWGNDQHIKLIELLVEAGADLDAKTLNDETVFDLCDNIDLLEKLNQLKDKALNPDRLKRTQSRTNSRVHSVRRTSVRDKNQISRREAREEAMLRTETMLPSANDKAPVSTNLDLVPSNGVLANGSSKAERNGSGELADNSSSSRPPANGIDLSDKSSVGQRPNRESFESISLAVDGDASFIANDPSTGSDLVDARPINTTTTTTTTTTNTARDQPCDQKMGASLSFSQTNYDTNCNSNQNTVCDQMTRCNSQPSAVQYTLINYTLSNLKKHRSDLRMRTTSIGGNSSSNNSDSSQAADQTSSVATISLNPKQGSGGHSNGKPDTMTAPDRPGSPSLNFRKFHGEPSELVGGGRRKSCRKCCLII